MILARPPRPPPSPSDPVGAAPRRRRAPLWGCRSWALCFSSSASWSATSSARAHGTIRRETKTSSWPRPPPRRPRPPAAGVARRHHAGRPNGSDLEAVPHRRPGARLQGNAPVPETRDRVLYRAGFAPEARQVSDDLGLGDPVRLTPTDPISAPGPATRSWSPWARRSARPAAPRPVRPTGADATGSGAGATDATGSAGTDATGAEGGRGSGRRRRDPRHRWTRSWSWVRSGWSRRRRRPSPMRPPTHAQGGLHRLRRPRRARALRPGRALGLARGADQHLTTEHLAAFRQRGGEPPADAQWAVAHGRMPPGGDPAKGTLAGAEAYHAPSRSGCVRPCSAVHRRGTLSRSNSIP